MTFLLLLVVFFPCQRCPKGVIDNGYPCLRNWPSNETFLLKAKLWSIGQDSSCHTTAHHLAVTVASRPWIWTRDLRFMLFIWLLRSLLAIIHFLLSDLLCFFAGWSQKGIQRLRFSQTHSRSTELLGEISILTFVANIEPMTSQLKVNHWAIDHVYHAYGIV